MKNLLKSLKSKAMLQIALFAALFGVMDVFIEMKKKTEEQTTYSVTLEDLLHAQTETDGEAGGAGGGGADGEDGGGTPGGGGNNGESDELIKCRTVEKRVTLSSTLCNGKSYPHKESVEYSCLSGSTGTCISGKTTIFTTYNSNCVLQTSTGVGGVVQLINCAAIP